MAEFAIADSNTLDTEYLSKTDLSRWSHKNGYYSLCRKIRKVVHISTFTEVWLKTLAAKNLSAQLLSSINTRRKATVSDKRRLTKEFHDENTIDGLERDAITQGAALLKSGMKYDTTKTIVNLEDGVKRRKLNYATDVVCAFKNTMHYLPELLGKEIAADLISDIKRRALKPPSVWTHIVKYLDAVLNAPKEGFEDALRQTVSDKPKFQLYCKKVLTDFYHLVDIFPTISMNIGERKYIVQNVSPLFKFYERTFDLMYFNWIEAHSYAAKLARLPSESGIVKVDANGIRIQDNQETWHLEVAGSPSIFSMKHANDNTRKSMNLELLTLIAVLREYLSAPIRLAKKLKVFSCQVIGDRITLYSLNLIEGGKFLAEELESAKIPFSFSSRMRYMGIFKMIARFHDELMEQEEIIGKLEASLYVDIDESPKVRDVLTFPDKSQMLPYTKSKHQAEVE
ncbi:16467_t:CDS:2 [Funneliformis geosporum]|uniref:14854_t:CDS:1 n=1 Tax=Funneliformis geosporum TaxID=1117311 RepID=A0A9W4SBG3_9GLOM|nr:14854_t:CDS:2 [Funneliformis geosporum]CAI2163152.1 16467_t:CDS:2 [Funneliformis geosporum]